MKLLSTAAIAFLTLVATADTPLVVNAAPDHHIESRHIDYSGNGFQVVELDPRQFQVRMYWKRPDGQRLGNFGALERLTAASRQPLLFATNAGIFDPHFVPLGLLIVDGQTQVALNLESGSGNFFLKPNGVFLIDGTGPRIVDAAAYSAITSRVRMATQSGPLLLLDGVISATLKPDSTSRKIRSAVGVTPGGLINFVLSEKPVTFYALADFFKSRLGCRDALHLDGTISCFYLHGRPGDPDSDFAAMIGVTQRN